MKRFESKEQAGLFYFVEPGPGGRCFVVISQAKGFPATEAVDDWFGNESDAIEVARKLANGEFYG